MIKISESLIQFEDLTSGKADKAIEESAARILDAYRSTLEKSSSKQLQQFDAPKRALD
jgi:hypothetical protein